MKSKAYRRYERLLFAVCGLAGLLYGIDMGFGGDMPCQVPVNTGSTGEGFLLSLDERKRVYARTVKAAKGRLKLVAHVGCLNTKDACELARKNRGTHPAKYHTVFTFEGTVHNWRSPIVVLRRRRIRRG